jgi:hypothetical protein
VKHALVFGMSAAVLVGLAGCASTGTHLSPAAAHVSIAPDLPPSPATWPAYPQFSQHSCWGRPFPSGVISQRPAGSAPSYAPAPRAHVTPPAKIVRQFLARLGDRRYVRSVTLGPASATIATHTRALSQYGGNHPPADALHAFIHAPLASYKNHAPHATPAQHLAYGIAEFEAGLVGGALRDDFCSVGGAPLISWSGDTTGGISQQALALEERFPNPTPAAFRHRVALVGRRFGFHVASLRLLRPEQLAPVLIVRTSRPRKAFVKDVGKIMTLLNPTSFAPHLRRVALTFEGFFFAAEDSRGPFFYTLGISRSAAEGSEWTASLCLLPPAMQMGPSSPKHCR